MISFFDDLSGPEPVGSATIDCPSVALADETGTDRCRSERRRCSGDGDLVVCARSAG
jgi:hypothetical protein